MRNTVSNKSIFLLKEISDNERKTKGVIKHLIIAKQAQDNDAKYTAINIFNALSKTKGLLNLTIWLFKRINITNASKL